MPAATHGLHATRLQPSSSSWWPPVRRTRSPMLSVRSLPQPPSSGRETASGFREIISAGMRGVSSRRTREVGSSVRSRPGLSPQSREVGADHSRDLRDADLCPVAQCVGNRSRDTCGAPLSIVVMSSAVIGTEGWGEPWTTSKSCAVLPSTTNTYSTNSSAPQGTRGTPRNPTVRWIPGRWRWCGWQPWPRSVAPFRPTDLRPMPRSMPAQAQPRWSTCWSASFRSSGSRVS